MEKYTFAAYKKRLNEIINGIEKRPTIISIVEQVEKNLSIKLDGHEDQFKTARKTESKLAYIAEKKKKIIKACSSLEAARGIDKIEEISKYTRILPNTLDEVLGINLKIRRQLIEEKLVKVNGDGYFHKGTGIYFNYYSFFSVMDSKKRVHEIKAKQKTKR